eukprot:TCALIF_07225-PA protein Name:"Similar to Dpy30 Protein dpy-30 homolog (Mus musculus)" AED:0.04 eAED:0.04 QI:140/0.8/0.5/1/0.2/0.33/6/0/293
MPSAKSDMDNESGSVAKKAKMSQDVKSMSSKAFMDEFVVPVMLRALSAVNKERPDDPIDFLINYLKKEKAAPPPTSPTTTAGGPSEAKPESGPSTPAKEGESDLFIRVFCDSINLIFHMSTFSNFMELGTLFCYLLVLFWPKEVCEGQKIKAEFLSRGTKRFYFNSCSCGLLEVNEQDISSDWAKEKNALIEKNLRNLFKSRRRRKREAEQSAKSIRINLSLTINMDSKDGNFSGNIVANPEKVRSKHILRTMDHLMLDEYSVEMEAVSPESLESLGPNWRNMGSQDKNCKQN